MSNPFSISGEQMQAIVAKALFDGLTPEAKDAMVVKALKDSLAAVPEDGNRGYNSDRRSRFQREFDSAVSDVTRLVVADAIKSNADVRVAIEQMISDAFKKLVDRDSDQWGRLTAGIADAIEKTLTKDRY